MKPIDVPPGLLSMLSEYGGPDVVLDWLADGRLSGDERDALERDQRPILLRCSELLRVPLYGLWTQGQGRGRFVLSGVELERRLRRDVVGRLCELSAPSRHIGIAEDWCESLFADSCVILNEAALVMSSALERAAEAHLAVPQGYILAGSPDLRLVVTTRADLVREGRRRRFGPKVKMPEGQSRMLWSCDRADGLEMQRFYLRIPLVEIVRETPGPAGG